MCVAAVTKWGGWHHEGQDVPCTPENVRALLTAPKARHIYNQVHYALNNHHDFFAAASAS
jgi:hypothetical protein